MTRIFLIITFLFPLFLTAETIIVKTKAPQNRNAVLVVSEFLRTFVADGLLFLR